MENQNEVDEEELYTIEEFRNETELSFTDISSERYREYTFPDGESIRIDRPLMLCVKEDSGSHRVWDAHGVSHRVSPGWIELKWESKEGEPHFVL